MKTPAIITTCLWLLSALSGFAAPVFPPPILRNYATTNEHPVADYVNGTLTNSISGNAATATTATTATNLPRGTGLTNTSIYAVDGTKRIQVDASNQITTTNLNVNGSASVSGILSAGGLQGADDGISGISPGHLASGTLPGLTFSGNNTNAPGATWTGGELRTNWSTGNWMTYTNGVSQWGPSNAPATVVIDGAAGTVTAGSFSGTVGASNLTGVLGLGNLPGSVVTNNESQTITLSNTVAFYGPSNQLVGGSLPLTIETGSGMVLTHASIRVSSSGNLIINAPGQVDFNLDYGTSINFGPAASVDQAGTVTGGRFAPTSVVCSGVGTFSGTLTATNGIINYGTGWTGTTNATAPSDTATIKAWANYTNSAGNLFKMPLYQ